MTEAAGHRIVVGIDGSEGSRRALRWALGEAAARGGGVLEVVNAWSCPALGELAGVVAPNSPRVVLEQQAHDLVDACVEEAGTGDEVDGVELRPVVVEGDPAAALLDAADGADLLVLGSRGRGSVGALLLGSVSHACIHHATCPVTIVPDRDHGSAWPGPRAVP